MSVNSSKKVLILTRNNHKFKQSSSCNIIDGDIVGSPKNFNVVTSYIVEDNQRSILVANFKIDSSERKLKFIEIMKNLNEKYEVILSSDSDRSNFFML